MNDWKIIELHQTGTRKGEVQKVLRQNQKVTADKIKIGDISARNIDDKNANGCYVMEWNSVPYTLQDNGELVYDGLYYETTHGKTDLHVIFEMTCTIKVKYVLSMGIINFPGDSQKGVKFEIKK